jgi:hypothetical protein
VNRENIEKVIRAIETEKSKFDLRYYGRNLYYDSIAKFAARFDEEELHLKNPECRTVCCICGWANAIAMNEIALSWDMPYFSSKANPDDLRKWEKWIFTKSQLSEVKYAAKYLGLPIEFAKELFIPIDFTDFTYALANTRQILRKNLTIKDIYDSIYSPYAKNKSNKFLNNYPWLFAVSQNLISPPISKEGWGLGFLIWPDFWAVSADDAIIVLNAILDEVIPIPDYASVSDDSAEADL